MTKRILTFIVVFAYCVVLGGQSLLSAFSVKASAAETSYSNVLDDLKKDSDFNVADYPAKADDYSLQVIQIAEGENGELFVYVYQPNFEYSGVKASYINLSLQDQRDKSAELKNRRYSLTFLNSNGALCKYIVNGFSIASEAVRYYSISGIYRPFVDGVDASYEAIDNKNHTVFKVGRMWCVYKYNDALTYESLSFNVFRAEITASGEIYYPDGYLLHLSGCNSHYFAFKALDYDVEYIYDADVTYNLIPYWHTTTTEPAISSDREVVSVDSETLYDTEFVTYEAQGVLGKTYTWKRIQTSIDFLQEVKDYGLSEEEINGIKSADYVFRVAESHYSEVVNWTTGESTSTYYRLQDAGILRLHFATPTGVYNIGAISDLVGTDGVPDGSDDPDLKEWFGEWFEKLLQVLSIVLLVLILIFLSNPITALLRIIWNGLKFVFNLLLYLLAFPFKLLGGLFKTK